MSHRYMVYGKDVTYIKEHNKKGELVDSYLFYFPKTTTDTVQMTTTKKV